MTAPVSVFSGLVQPVARAAMGDAVGAGLSGFDALLALLGQALGEIADGQGAATADANPEAPLQDAEADGETTGDPSLAAWLMRGPDSALVAQTLGLSTGSTEDPATAQSPETCSLPVKPDADASLQDGASPQPDVQRPDVLDGSVWGRAARPGVPAREQTDTATLLARLRETAPPAAAAPVAEATVEPVETPTGDAAAALVAETVAETVPPDVARQAAAAAAPADPRPSASRKPGAAASAAAELKTGRQDASSEPDTSKTPSPTDSADIVAEAPELDSPPPEPQLAQASARQGERPEAVTQALIARLEGLSANAAALAAQVRGAPETVAKLAAGILDKLGGQSTRFDLQLDPHGLGKVDVAVEIAADGRLTAQLGFDNAQGLAELRGRAQELRQALEQAGFSLADNSLSFDFSGQRQRQDAQPDTPNPSAGQAFARALGLAEDEADAAPIRYQARRGLDLLV